MITVMSALPRLTASPCGVRIACLFDCYAPFSFARFWSDEAGRAACLMDGVLTLSMTDLPEEWRAFVAMLPDVRVVAAENAVGEQLAAIGRPAVSFPILRADALPATTADAIAPRPAYTLLKTVFGDAMPAFDGWYADVSHRMRRDRCHPMGTAVSADGAVIGGVATDPAYRRQGLATKAVAALGHRFTACSRPVYICPKNESAARLYRQLGFYPAGQYFQIEGNAHDPVV